MSFSAASQDAYRSAMRITSSPRDVEYRVFADVTAELRRAARDDAPKPEVIGALHRNIELWNVLCTDVVSSDNKLPDALKAQLLSLAAFVNRHSRQVRRGEASMDPLIDVNAAVMRGLKAVADAAEGA